jgi:hypothetical protein
MILLVPLNADMATCVIVSSLGVYDGDSAPQVTVPCVPASGTLKVAPSLGTNSFASWASGHCPGGGGDDQLGQVGGNEEAAARSRL